MDRRRVLVVEDDDDLRDVLVESLSSEGHAVVPAAPSALPRGPFGVVLTDVPFWPYEAVGTRRWIGELRSLYADARVILCTPQRCVHREPDGLGADAIIDMPFDLGELLARVASSLDTRLAQRGALGVGGAV